MPYGRNLHDSQDLYINGERLRGVQQAAVSWQGQEAHVNAIGYKGGYLGSVTEQSMQADIEVERLIVSASDPLIYLFDSENISGEIAYGDGSNFAFNEGFITSYSCGCAVGEVPSLNFSISAFGESGGNVASLPQTPALDNNTLIADPGSIILDVEGHSTNRIQSFEILISVVREPYHVLGQLKPLVFSLQFPIQVDCSFVMHVDNHESSNLFDFICSPTIQDLYFYFRDCESGEDIRKFFIKQAKLVDYNHSGSIHESLEATFTYKALLNDINDIQKIISGIIY